MAVYLYFQHAHASFSPYPQTFLKGSKDSMGVLLHFFGYRTVHLRNDILSRTGFIPPHPPYGSSHVNRTVHLFTLWRCYKHRAFSAPFLPACNNSYSYCSFSPISNENWRIHDSLLYNNYSHRTVCSACCNTVRLFRHLPYGVYPVFLFVRTCHNHTGLVFQLPYGLSNV